MKPTGYPQMADVRAEVAVVQAAHRHPEPVRNMSRRQVWDLLKQGCNAAEIAAAAHVSDAVASSMVDEALGRARGESLREQDRQLADHRVGHALGGVVISL